MRRALAVVAVAVVVSVGWATHVGAVQETPSGRFTSPTRAVANQPIFVRSITPCPTSPGAYLFVRVGISPQSKPNSLDYIESTDADLRPDGSWEVTLSAPEDMANGVTKSYDIQAQCIVNEAPYDAPSRDPSVTETTLPPEASYFRYFQRRLYVTGFAGADAAPAGTASTDEAQDATTTSSTTTTQPTPTTLPIPTTTTIGSLSSQSFTQSLRPDDEDDRAAEARAELARRDPARQVALSSTASASSATPQPEPSGGIPWWAFAAATMLAVGAVVGWGAKRSASADL